MKTKYFTIICILLSVFSCSRMETGPVLSRDNRPGCIANQVSLNDIDSYISVKGFPSTKGERPKIEPIVFKRDTVMYLVNYQKGWELLSGVKKASRVLMKSETGVHSYDIDPHSYDVDPLEEGRAFKEQSLFACKQAAA